MKVQSRVKRIYKSESGFESEDKAAVLEDQRRWEMRQKLTGFVEETFPDRGKKEELIESLLANKDQLCEIYCPARKKRQPKPKDGQAEGQPVDDGKTEPENKDAKPDKKGGGKAKQK